MFDIHNNPQITHVIFYLIPPFLFNLFYSTFIIALFLFQSLLFFISRSLFLFLIPFFLISPRSPHSPRSPRFHLIPCHPISFPSFSSRSPLILLSFSSHSPLTCFNRLSYIPLLHLCEKVGGLYYYYFRN